MERRRGIPANNRARPTRHRSPLMATTRTLAFQIRQCSLPSQEERALRRRGALSSWSLPTDLLERAAGAVPPPARRKYARFARGPHCRRDLPQLVGLPSRPPRRTLVDGGVLELQQDVEADLHVLDGGHAGEAHLECR